MKILPFKLERFFAKHEFKAPYLLCSSDCESFSVQELLSFEPGSVEVFQQRTLGYTESQGDPELRREITRLYQQIESNDILVHAGAEEAIFIFMNVVLERGDHIIVHYPCYQSFFEIARAIDCEVTKWETTEQDDWELDVSFLKQQVRNNTKAIVINCPHNPTGYLMNKEKLLQIIEIAKEHNLLVFSDEVYRYLEYRDENRLPAACDVYENAVSLGVMSKAYGLAGLRIGWIATKNQNIYKDMADFKDYTSICNSAPSEFLATLALRNKNKIVQRNLDIILRNIEVLNDFFSRYQSLFNWLPPKAGSIAFPSIKMDIDIESFCLDLVEKKGVLLLPSNYFDFGDKNFRIGFGRRNLPEGIEKLEQYVIQTF